jgi:hypothetical protein
VDHLLEPFERQLPAAIEDASLDHAEVAQLALAMHGIQPRPGDEQDNDQAAEQPLYETGHFEGLRTSYKPEAQAREAVNPRLRFGFVGIGLRGL